MTQPRSHSSGAALSSCLLIGEEGPGRWVVADRRGHRVGSFGDAKQAIHFAMFESEGAPRAAIMAPVQRTRTEP
jgi:hypothetical protein